MYIHVQCAPTLVPRPTPHFRISTNLGTRLPRTSASTCGVHCTHVNNSYITLPHWLYVHTYMYHTSLMVSIMGDSFEAFTLMLSNFSRTSVSPEKRKESVFSSCMRPSPTLLLTHAHVHDTQRSTVKKLTHSRHM